MVFSSLLSLLDDIATVLDDVAVLTKVAAKKTAGVLGDDLALNAQQVSGVSADRELHVVWSVAKGSFINKFILVPCALIISAFIPWLITPLLTIGGLYLCFEGMEKIVHSCHNYFAKKKQESTSNLNANVNTSDLEVAVKTPVNEKEKIKGAIRTDFILSAEIIVITLGTVEGKSLLLQSTVLSGIALIITVGVYGLVACIVKLDDFGLWLTKSSSAFKQFLGAFILRLAPWLMHTLSILGTTAMFLVGGGILLHSIPHGLLDIEGAILTALTALIIGLVAGGILLSLIQLYERIRNSFFLKIKFKS